jgi:hypothetical protein
MKFIAISGIALLLSSQALASQQKNEPKTAEAVISADDGWMDAEIRGDGKYLSKLLLDGYVSIGSAGKITTKEQIISTAVKRGKSEQFANEVSNWKSTHPSRASVTLFGDTAILTWNSIDPNSTTPVHSSDVFVYRSGHWLAIYSQHTSSSN